MHDGVAPDPHEPVLRADAARQNVHELEVERKHDGDDPVAVVGNAAEGASRGPTRDDAAFADGCMDAHAALGIRFDREQRRVNRQLRYAQMRPVLIERIEPKRAPAFVERFVSQRRGERRFGIGREGGEPGAPRGTHALVGGRRFCGLHGVGGSPFGNRFRKHARLECTVALLLRFLTIRSRPSEISREDGRVARRGLWPACDRVLGAAFGPPAISRDRLCVLLGATCGASLVLLVAAFGPPARRVATLGGCG